MKQQLKHKYHKNLAVYYESKNLYLDIIEHKKPNIRKLAEQPWQEVHGLLWGEYRKTLLDFGFIKTKILSNLFLDLIQDYDLYKRQNNEVLSQEYKQQNIDYRVLGLLQKTLKLIFPIVNTNIQELVSQLVGRLKRVEEQSIQILLHEAENYCIEPILIPIIGNLCSPTDKLVQTIYEPYAIMTLALIEPDELLISGSTGGEIMFRELKSNSIVKKIPPNNKGVYVKVIPALSDKYLIASSVMPDDVSLINIENGIEESSLIGHTGKVSDIYVCDASSMAVTASWDRTLKLWQLPEAKCLHTFEGHKANIECLTMNHDRKYMYSGSLDGELIIWNMADYQIVKILKSKWCQVQALSFQTKHNLLVAGYGDGTIVYWNLDNYECVAFKEHIGPINRLLITADGNYLISCSADRKIIIRDFESGTVVNTLIGNSDVVNDIVLTRDDKRLISVSEDKTIRIWNIFNKSSNLYYSHESNVFSTAISDDGENAITGSSTGMIKFWKTKTYHNYASSQLHKDLVSSIKILPDNKALSASYDYTLRVWNINNGEIIRTFWLNVGKIIALAITPDANKVIIGTSSGKIACINYSDGEEIWVKELHTRGINRLDISFNSKFLVSTTDLGDITIMRVDNGKKLQTLYHPEWTKEILNINPSSFLSGTEKISQCNCIFMPKSSFIITSNHDRIYKWNWRRKMLIDTITGNVGLITCLRVSNNGHYLFSVKDGSSLDVWDARSKQRITSFTTDGPICSLSITPNGDKIVIGEQSGKIHFLEFRNQM